MIQGWCHRDGRAAMATPLFGAYMLLTALSMFTVCSDGMAGGRLNEYGRPTWCQPC